MGLAVAQALSLCEWKVTTMRVSEAALALITRIGPGGVKSYLTQWNQKWQAYSLIGGHRRLDESFRDCCIREVEEELGLQRDIDFYVALEPITPQCEYCAFSQSARVMTQYRIELFPTQINSSRCIEKLSTIPGNRWVTEPEARNKLTNDDQPVAVQVMTILTLCRVI